MIKIADYSFYESKESQATYKEKNKMLESIRQSTKLPNVFINLMAIFKELDFPKHSFDVFFIIYYFTTRYNEYRKLSLDFISETVGVSKSTIQRCLNRLVKMNLVKKTQENWNSKTYKDCPKLYSINFDALFSVLFDYGDLDLKELMIRKDVQFDHAKS